MANNNHLLFFTRYNINNFYYILFLFFDIGIAITPDIIAQTAGTIIIARIPNAAATIPIIMVEIAKPLYNEMNDTLEHRPVFLLYHPVISAITTGRMSKRTTLLIPITTSAHIWQQSTL